ncbi:MAG: CmcJ/NvfI family oxidoreductase [Candidatus Binatus sp.]|uniref:CmcJ/NvfI family oxidoreductase n=1 Tax=Candidatus Binatus sp. TaxID=2811406 RepID=UPI003BAED744
MAQLNSIENHVAGVTSNVSSVYVPPLQLTKGQPPPIAANGGLSYMSFDRNGDAGTAAATAAALRLLAEGQGQAVTEMLDKAPPGPIETRWGVGFRSYSECLEYIRANDIEAPEGGVALPLRYSVFEQPSYSIVSSNALWRDPARADLAKALRKEEQDVARRCLYFPQVLRDARRIEKYYPGLSPNSPECMDKLGVALGHCESKCGNFYDAAEVERVFYPEIEKLLLEVFPGATDALVYNHDVFDKDYKGDRTEDQDNKNPGVNANYAYIVHNDLNDNSGRVRCRELLTKNLRNFGREQHYTAEQADAKMSRRFMSINLAKPMETVRQNPFVLCAWPSFADQPYITNYRIYDDRVGETTRFTYRHNHEWYWFPQQKPTEVSMLKCYDSVTDGSVSRWSFHSACIDPTAPDDAPCRRNVVVRSFVFF